MVKLKNSQIGTKIGVVKYNNKKNLPILEQVGQQPLQF